MSRTFIIKVLYGGLGDHLFFSHLPRIAKESCGYSRVYVSERSEYRNPDYKNLIWETNPFVDGFVPDDAPCEGTAEFEPGMNLLDWIMLNRGLDDGRRFHEPELYYHPNVSSSFSNVSVYDPNYVSYVGEVSRRRVTRLVLASPTPLAQLAPREKCFSLAAGSPNTITTPTIYEYCDLIASCKAFYCLSSGGATLAAALGVPSTVFYGSGQPTIYHHSRIHKYVEASLPVWRAEATRLHAKIRAKGVRGSVILFSAKVRSRLKAAFDWGDLPQV
jgi:hypothetical protein